MSAYRFIVAFIVFIVAAFLWIPLDYVFDQVTGVMNGIAVNPDTIERNNIVRQGFYYSLFIILIVIIIYILKPTKGETEQGEVVYAPIDY